MDWVGLSMLLLDPDRDRATYTRELLSHRGIVKVHPARSGGQALAVLRRSTVDLALVDFSNPDDDLRLFMADLRNPHHTPALGLPVLAILAEATRENIRRTISLGASHVVIRPFSAADLFRRIDGVLNQPIPQFSDDSYVGPDRRRLPEEAYAGPKRRGDESGKPGTS